MLNAKQMADEIRTYRLADPGLETRHPMPFPTWSARDCRRKTRPIRLMYPDPVAPTETELWFFTRNPFGHIVGRIDLTAPDADERLARYEETAEA